MRNWEKPLNSYGNCLVTVRDSCGLVLCDDEPMDITKMLTDLYSEREAVEQAILVLERIAAGRGKRRGRPPAWMTQVKRRGRPKGSKNKPKEE